MKPKQFFMNPRAIIIVTAVFLCLFAGGQGTVMAQAQDETQDIGDDVDSDADSEVDADISAFSSPAQAQRAQNVAEAAAVTSDDDVAQALSDLEAAQVDGDEAAIEAAQDALDQARAAAIANVTDEDIAEIESLRAEGMGWGQIAHAKGIHPSALGLGNKYGHTQSHRDQSMAAHGYGKQDGAVSSTRRDTKTGGNAYGLSKADKGKGASNVGGIGKGLGKSNGKGGKGGGQGGGRGGGQGGGKGKD